jgi:hypothetical protein
MMSPEAVERLRRMTLTERLRMTLQMMREATPHLLAGSPEEVDRRFELIRRQNDDRNRRILEALARARGAP